MLNILSFIHGREIMICGVGKLKIKRVLVKSLEILILAGFPENLRGCGFGR